MSKTYPKAGRLEKAVTVTVSTQESAYRTLLSVPCVRAKDRIALMRAVVNGPAISWIRLAFQKGLLPERNASGRKSIERFLAGSGTENALVVLRGTRRKHFRQQAIARLSQDPKSAYRVLKARYLNLSRAEEKRLIDMILPTLTGNQAQYLLGRQMWTNEDPLNIDTGRRLKLIEGLCKGRHRISIAAQLLLSQGGTSDTKFARPFTKAERSILISLAIQHTVWAYSLMSPSHDCWDAQLTDEEKKNVVPAASKEIQDICKRRTLSPREVSKIEHLLEIYSAFLDTEQKTALEQLLATARQKVA